MTVEGVAGADGALHPVRFEAIPGWSDDTLADTLPGLQAECRRLALLPVDTVLGGSGTAALLEGRAGQWAPACAAAASLPPGDAAGARRFYETWFQPYRIGTPALVTGYYEPEVRGALAPGGVFATPILARPTDLVQARLSPDRPDGPTVGRSQNGRLVPYWTRAEIEAGRAGYAARPLLWLADPADLFLLQVQGAGRIRLADGTVVRVAYDGHNGRAYVPLGRVLVEQGALPADGVTLPAVRAWLTAHPAQARAVMDRNDDYVFFRVLLDADAGEGPPGALGVRLQPGRAAAVDRRAVPLGAALFLDTTDPVDGRPWRRLVLAQDFGEDVAGAATADLFLGAGDAAEQRAGRMHQGGTAYMLLPKLSPESSPKRS